ncbi:N-succinylarginine dihydrolase [Pseudomonas sp. AN-1]|uniref:N-succinylarginine dihydrolase n=1 Tax=Pseudomonas sp. AN-1 TaxID=3096605 RepID=UPI002A6AAB7D|nr:N-succinylarginine dihydrolase [Pseudomonas sp. AN-1]WPP47610.1 N-succinylarginine dihydrolase [Pseudomonas sp. AN-1]
MSAVEVNFDGLVGSTHNYAGLSPGNLASMGNREQPADPRGAALQGLAKMRRLLELGFVQGVLPPQERPDLATLRALGFAGSDAQVLARAAGEAPALLTALGSAASMWTANAATVSPGADTADGRVHFTAANLHAQLHRSIEHPATSRVLQTIFSDPRHFAHHPALPAHASFGDEGAANHTRLCRSHGEPGVELFVYGRSAFDPQAPQPQRYPARQSREASAAVARLHGLDAGAVVFAQQQPAAIDAGVFHNDVIAVGNGELLLYHEDAFLDGERVLAELADQLARRGGRLQALCVSRAALSLEQAVHSYLFNSQLLTRADGSMLLLVPEECREQAQVWAWLQALLAADNPIRAVEVVDLRQSMRNGGGPACLRLRVVLTPEQLAATHAGVLLTPALCDSLERWVARHYRDRLVSRDLADPQLLDESRAALDELTQILKLGALYSFQRV